MKLLVTTHCKAKLASPATAGVAIDDPETIRRSVSLPPGATSSTTPSPLQYTSTPVVFACSASLAEAVRNKH